MRISDWSSDVCSSDLLVNYEISSLIIGKRPGDYGFTVNLTGLITESFYIFGPRFFLLHGIFCGFIAGAAARIVEGTRCYQILAIYLAMLMLHTLNRGGKIGRAHV